MMIYLFGVSMLACFILAILAFANIAQGRRIRGVVCAVMILTLGSFSPLFLTANEENAPIIVDSVGTFVMLAGLCIVPIKAKRKLAIGIFVTGVLFVFMARVFTPPNITSGGGRGCPLDIFGR